MRVSKEDPFLLFREGQSAFKHQDGYYYLKNISQGFVPSIIFVPKSQASIDYISRENQLN
tara:strand:+ start:141 stop:320 length:180 start_codon:yes stop_codon:yes gene_type:complete